jgi:hypothetical protein
MRAAARAASSLIGRIDQRLHALRPAPIILIGLEHDAGVGDVLDELERAGADRLPAVAVEADLLHIGRRHHVGERKLRRQHGIRNARDQPHLVIVDDLDLPHPGVVGLRRGDHRGIVHGVVEEFHRLRVERLAVLEFHALPQRQLPGDRVDVLPARREIGPELARRLPSQQRVGDVIHQRAVRHDHQHIERVHAGHVGAAGDDHAVLRARRSAEIDERKKRAGQADRLQQPFQHCALPSSGGLQHCRKLSQFPCPRIMASRT